ncbi:MAG: F-type H+-transporting ATPase subunit a [Candidatus Peregrinibacteria bacterium Greene1014_49]|nr:MAG: F-type H+-transporting ATPase subunit a [Candidatus Peregrinibacteria bacterium Greene1014_49]
MSAIHAPTLASETIAHIGPFEIRNTILMAWITMVLLIGVAGIAKTRGYKLIPNRLQSLLELIVEGILALIDSVMQDNKMTRKVFPMIATFFLFIMFANWLGIIPGVGSITVEAMHEGKLINVPLLRSMNADANVTLAFTLISVIATQILGLATVGIFGHLSKYIVAPWKKPYGIGTVVGILEFVGEFARLISFVFRLFGNIFAGEVLLVVISFLVPYILPIPFLGLEIFVGFIQALVFSLLTVAFIKMAVTAHGEAHA